MAHLCPRYPQRAMFLAAARGRARVRRMSAARAALAVPEPHRGGATTRSEDARRENVDVATASNNVVPFRRKLPETVPDAPPASAEEVRALASFITAAERLLVITGAGCSTESAIPDYRSPKGAYSTGFKPMTHQDFLRADGNRKRYWARSFVGWKKFAEGTSPNRAHVALAALQREGHVWRLITQNVDRLHHAAGSEDALELHGTTHEVICLNCDDVTPRTRMQRRLIELNPTFLGSTLRDAEDVVKRQNPDGDVELDGGVEKTFKLPTCLKCGTGTLKPKVVFFGDCVPAKDASVAKAWSERADAVLVVGSSVSTFSAYKLVKEAVTRGAPVAILTNGDTRVDDVADLKVRAVAGETLSRILDVVRREETYGY